MADLSFWYWLYLYALSAPVAVMYIFWLERFESRVFQLKSLIWITAFWLPTLILMGLERLNTLDYYIRNPFSKE
ncbi:hypothetical protein [Paraferrimonas sedimenticola]|uniref:Uncharacterized protein n=1 Tax=Paraferrimonas sedimenticola TaxID=375674 RepID=A0AA37RUX8_9GAMM|nr:hypothetical protein [Paraferrimonas sedimenticola]GLP95309.1 hypothetical protein GCM10007895_06150 [Paraferrimonas sedimenticola]